MLEVVSSKRSRPVQKADDYTLPPTTMLRHYTHTFSIMWLAFLLVAPLLVSGHMIEVPASKKECFFEDLHVHDKVRPL